MEHLCLKCQVNTIPTGRTLCPECAIRALRASLAKLREVGASADLQLALVDETLAYAADFSYESTEYPENE